MLKTDSRRRSAVGRMSRDAGAASVRPRNRPPTMRIRKQHSSPRGRWAPLPLAGRGWGWGCQERRAPVGYPPACPSPARGEGTERARKGEGSSPIVWRESSQISSRPPLLVLRLEIALAVIAALGAPRRAITVRLVLVARARLLAA